MANQNISKVIYAGNVLMDLTGDTVTPSAILAGYKAHDKSGAAITGTCSFNANTNDGTAAAAEILSGKIAYVKGSKVTGTMVNNGAITGTISTKTGTYTVPIGYHDGSGKVSIASTEQAKIIASNIREGVTILGVTGTMSSTEGAKPQAKTITPTTASQEVLPDTGYNYLSSVTVEAIPYTETDNDAGGITVTIAG